MSDLKVPPMFEPGEIVIVCTKDAQYGHIQVPGIVRYLHEGIEETGAPEGYYAVALIIPAGPHQQYLVHPMWGVTQWDLKPHEMKKTHLRTVVEYPRDAESGRYMFMPDKNSKEIEQIGGRIIIG